ncbi:reverse transcriptase [Senna tora]|uniref:Reverse transcriptase n=1 Tax=Senna tora TaxID=362788 RepID=A0A834U4V2_9FABA|nr:reverse transcriptase [Senna tora]
MWLKNLEYKNVIISTWNTSVHGSRAFQVASKLKIIAHSLSNWNKANYSHLKLCMREVEEELFALRRDQVNPQTREKERLRQHLNHLLDCEQTI